MKGTTNSSGGIYVCKFIISPSRMEITAKNSSISLNNLYGEPSELKHLSKTRKRNQKEIPLVMANETGTI